MYCLVDSCANLRVEYFPVEVISSSPESWAKNNEMFDQNGFQNGPKKKSFGSYFSEQVRKLKSVFGSSRLARIAYEPIPWRGQGDPKVEEKKDNLICQIFEN